MDILSLQRVYVVYTGQGGEKYLTSESEQSAARFLMETQKEFEVTKYTSLFACNVYIQGKGTWWLRNGIPVAIHLPIVEAGKVVAENVL